VKLLVLGATGGTGQQLVRQALEHGHDVTVLVRSPEKLKVEDQRLRVRIGSVMDAMATDEAVAGHEAVLITLGSNEPRELFRPRVMSSSTKAVVAAMERQGVSRVVLLSALGVGESAPLAPARLRIAFKTALRQVEKDKAVAEAYIRSKNLDWTIVYPPPLTNGPATDNIRSGDDLRVAGSGNISRADVAAFMLAQVTDLTYSRKNVVISS
jgi:uncharacterized protein YbjT (DUF2867 family)